MAYLALNFPSERALHGMITIRPKPRKHRQCLQALSSLTLPLLNVRKNVLKL